MKNHQEAAIEEIVLMKLIEKGPEGVTYHDFPEHLNLDAEALDQVMQRLEHGLYASVLDHNIKLDS